MLQPKYTYHAFEGIDREKNLFTFGFAHHIRYSRVTKNGFHLIRTR